MDNRWSAADRVILAMTLVTAVATSFIAVRAFTQRDGTPDDSPRVSKSLVRRVSLELSESKPRAAAIETVLVFTDYQCPSCRALSPTLRAIERDRRTSVLVLIAPFPIEALHANARSLALLALCVDSKVATLDRDSVLYAHADSIISLATYALMSRVSKVAAEDIRSCVASESTASRLNRLTALADELPVKGTPTIVVRGRVYTGALSRRSIDSLMVSPE